MPKSVVKTLGILEIEEENPSGGEDEPDEDFNEGKENYVCPEEDIALLELI